MGNRCKDFSLQGIIFMAKFLEFQETVYLTTLAIFIYFLKHIYFCIWVYQALVEGYKTLVATARRI